MKQILIALLLFTAGCTDSVDELVDNLLDDYEYEEEYECASGDASLPFGTYPEELITPEGYQWECTGGGADSIRIDSDGTFSATLSAIAYSANLDYFSECPGYISREETGEWVIDVNGYLCVKFDNVQPGYYNCQRITYGSGAVRGLSCIDYYEDGNFLANECNRYGRLGTCTLKEE